MKVIFLDIDGVLNSTSSYIAYGGYPWPDTDRDKFQWVSVKLLQKLIEKTDAKVVLSSTWRDHVDLKEFSDFLGVDIIGRTRGSIGDQPRGVEIAEWIELNAPSDFKYVILDDNSDMLEDQMDNFVFTDEDIGFMYRDYKQALRILGSK
jgi:hypothetical protein